MVMEGKPYMTGLTRALVLGNNVGISGCEVVVEEPEKNDR